MDDIPRGPAARNGAGTPKSPDIPGRDFSTPQVIENIDPLDTKNRHPKGFRYRFQWHKVNDCTWKLACDELTRVPTCHGFWCGYNTPKAIAWVIQVAPGNWLARYRDEACEPCSLNEAKARALAMAKGAVGDYVVENPIQHLNGLAARLGGDAS
jgi:hypothetical protein